MSSSVCNSQTETSLGMEAIEEGVMQQKPKPKKEGLFANGYGVRITPAVQAKMNHSAKYYEPRFFKSGVQLSDGHFVFTLPS